MKIVFMASLTAALAAFLCAVPRASAEPERYDFPAARVAKTVPQDAVVSAQTEIQKKNEARKDSIADLLQRHNRTLSEEKADDYADYIIQASEKFRQDPFVIAAVVVSESSARPDVVSKGGDYGLMQVRWRVHQKKIKKKYPQITQPKDILHPEYNLLVGTEIFSTYHATANQDLKGALLYYSSGNRRLTQKVFSVIAQLEQSYNKRLSNS